MRKDSNMDKHRYALLELCRVVLIYLPRTKVRISLFSIRLCFQQLDCTLSWQRFINYGGNTKVCLSHDRRIFPSHITVLQTSQHGPFGGGKSSYSIQFL